MEITLQDLNQFDVENVEINGKKQIFLKYKTVSLLGDPKLDGFNSSNWMQGFDHVRLDTN